MATLAIAYDADASQVIKVLPERFQRDDLIATGVVDAPDDCKTALGSLKIDVNGDSSEPKEKMNALRLFNLNKKQTSNRPSHSPAAA